MKTKTPTKTVKCGGCGKRFGGKQRAGFVGYEEKALCSRCEKDFLKESK